MRSVRFDRFGEPAEVLQVAEMPIPEPGARDILVRMRVRSINPSDLLTVRGLYGQLPALPATPGYEGMGTIERVGPAVNEVQPGMRVIPLGLSGTWQEYVVLRPTQLIPVPDSVSDATAAQFVVNPLTAWVMVTEELNVQAGEWLLQTAAGSTLGRVVLQIARLRGIKTINVVRRRAQAAELPALGADRVVCTDEEDLYDRVMEITGGAGVRAAIDAVGGETGSLAAQALARHGTLLVYGMLSLQPLTLDGGRMIFHSSAVRGFWLGDWFRSAPVNRRAEVSAELMGLMAKGEIVPPVEAEYDLGDVLAAVRHSETAGRHGKVLLVG